MGNETLYDKDGIRVVSSKKGLVIENKASGKETCIGITFQGDSSMAITVGQGYVVPVAQVDEGKPLLMIEVRPD